MIIKVEPMRSGSKRENAIQRARKAINKRLDILKFNALPEKEKEILKRHGLDPADRKESRVEYR